MEKSQEVFMSVVVPVYNEVGNIHPLHNELVAVLNELGKTYEIIYVNDASTDGSFKELSRLHGATIINLSRNYGQATVFDAGFRHARGAYVVSMDGDGQNDPRDIPALLARLQDGDFDVVAGFRKNRADKSGIRILTRIGFYFRKLLIGDEFHDTGCSFRIYTQEAVKSLDIGGEMHRYILALLKWKGFKIGEVVVNDRPRLFGKSKYTYTKAIRGFIDLLYVWFIRKYSQRPLHLFGYISFTATALGICTGVWTVYEKIVRGVGINHNGWMYITFFLFSSAILLFSFGIVIDLLIRIQFQTSHYERRYYIRSIHTV